MAAISKTLDQSTAYKQRLTLEFGIAECIWLHRSIKKLVKFVFWAPGTPSKSIFTPWAPRDCTRFIKFVIKVCCAVGEAKNVACSENKVTHKFTLTPLAKAWVTAFEVAQPWVEFAFPVEGFTS